MTDDEIEMFEFILDHFNKGSLGPLTDWERSFLRDQLDRYQQYGSDTRVSPKQWAIIRKCEEALVTGTTTRGAR